MAWKCIEGWIEDSPILLLVPFIISVEPEMLDDRSSV
jgi:hypothetical protein